MLGHRLFILGHLASRQETKRGLEVQTRSIILAVAGVVTLLAAQPGRAGPAADGFRARVDNPWFPFKPGSTYVYRGVKDGQPSRDVVKVTYRTKTIDGAPCVIIEDKLYLRGTLHERTTDWYTQDKRGNVWYFGEATAELDKHGRVTSTEGTWQAGRDGALPGIYMPARPTVGRSGRQEFYRGHPEDHFRGVSLHASVRTTHTAS